jgi:uncharacterized protein (TIGR02145 family)
MKKLLLKSGILLLMISSVTIGCKKDRKAPLNIPQVSTTGITEVTATTATSGGNISSEGGATVTVSGLCYSKANQTPTVTDDTTKTTASGGSFVSQLKNLDPGSTYYVRAYAINSVGIGYGNVVTFSTGNGAPQARNIKVTGDQSVGAVLTMAYSYFDFENNPEIGTTIQWYIANDSIGGAVTPIIGATAATYTLTYADRDRFLVVGITPKASSGTSPGTEAKSYWVGPIDAETVTFNYNGQTVSYGVIISSITGRKWLDRNLGAQRVATSYIDFLAYGDLFQWGRPADGHQLVTRVDVYSGTQVNGTSETLSTTDAPDNSLYIVDPNYTSPNFDWRNPKNDNLWQATAGQINNPCPAGWHIPTNAEWDAEIAGTEVVEDVLKLTMAGSRRLTDGSLAPSGPYDVANGTSGAGYYWSSTTVPTGTYTRSAYYNTMVSTSNTVIKELKSGIGDWRLMGYSCRCIKDQ